MSTQPQRMNLLRYEPEHQAAMLTLHRSAMSGFTTGMTRQEEEADLSAVEHVYISGGGEFLIGMLGERIVAMGGFKRLSDTTAELRRMRIERSLQGKGYGTQLLRELERLAFACGVRTLILETARARHLTLEFYRKQGYEETGQGYYGEVETVRFTKKLERTVCGTLR